MSRIPFVALLAVAILTLACSVFVGGPELPLPPPASSGDPLEELQAAVAQAAAESLLTGTLKLQLSEQQLSAYVASRLNAQDSPLLTDPRVVLGDQQMILYGRGRLGILEANLAVTTEFSIDTTGVPAIRITDAQLGPFPMPQALADTIAAAMDEALTGSIGPAALGFRLESIDISGGMMTLTGRVR